MIVNIRDLLKRHIVDGKFWRIDIIVKYFAILSYCNKKTFGRMLYDKFQSKRKGHNFSTFKPVIKSFKKNGWMHEEENRIPLNEYGRIHNGAHRLACCLYFDIDNIPVKQLTEDNFDKSIKDAKITIGWMKRNKFEKKTIGRVNKMCKKIFKKLDVL